MKKLLLIILSFCLQNSFKLLTAKQKLLSSNVAAKTPNSSAIECKGFKSGEKGNCPEGTVCAGFLKGTKCDKEWCLCTSTTLKPDSRCSGLKTGDKGKCPKGEICFLARPQFYHQNYKDLLNAYNKKVKNNFLDSDCGPNGENCDCNRFGCGGG